MSSKTVATFYSKGTQKVWLPLWQFFSFFSLCSGSWSRIKKFFTIYLTAAAGSCLLMVLVEAHVRRRVESLPLWHREMAKEHSQVLVWRWSHLGTHLRVTEADCPLHWTSYSSHLADGSSRIPYHLGSSTGFSVEKGAQGATTIQTTQLYFLRSSWIIHSSSHIQLDHPLTPSHFWKHH